MAFQAEVATWFAVHILVCLPVGRRFGINNQALPVAIRLETGDGLDDIEVTQSDGGAVHSQCKTSANISTGENAPLAKTIGQLVRWVANAKAAGSLPDPIRNAALLAVRADAARKLDNLETGCRAFDLGGSWAVTYPQRNQAERDALDALEAIVTPAWTNHRGAPPGDDDLTDLARVFHVARFAMEEGQSDWSECARLLGRHLFGDEAAGDAPLRDLKGIMRGLIGNGAPADRAGLLRALRKLGHQDVNSPGYDADIAKLRDLTNSELARLAVHGRLPLGPGLPITRESDTPLVAAILADSLLVVGEPGAGKTGALVHASAAIAAAGDTVVFLSVDRYPGVAITADLTSELGLTHPLVDVLNAMPGPGRKILIIDALDAARGGPSEAVFAGLIESVRERLAGDWIVVASIRTFDLKNGRRFRQTFGGSPADAAYADPALATVRHFLVPRLNESDLATVGATSPELGALLTSAPPALAELLRNIFNLSLAAELLADGADPAAFSGIRNQSGLIDAYEDARLKTTSMEEAARAAAAAMASRRRLSVRKVVIGHPSLDAVVQAGVLSVSGDLVSFAHHVLFDHVAGRYYLEWDDPNALLAQLAGDTATALQLAPALRFAVERLGRIDNAGRPLSWQLLIGVFSATSVDPVLGNVALRTVVESIENKEDIAGLVTHVAASQTDPALVPLLEPLARFAAMSVGATRPTAPEHALAWARLAEALVAPRERALLFPAYVLLQALFEHGDLTDPVLLDVFGRAARGMLKLAWEASPPLTSMSPRVIRFVGRSFGSDPAASRALLDRALREPHFSQYADREAIWIGEQILSITRADPEFTVEIYATLYGKTISDDATSWFGGEPSRIMPLSSNRRQDYESCRWQLGSAMDKVLAITPYHGTRALIDALIGKVATQGYGSSREPSYVNLGTTTIELHGYQIESNAWEEKEDERSRHDDLLRHYVGFLRTCDAATFETSVVAASRGYATPAVWSRIFGIGSERVAEVGGLLWPLIERPDFLENSGTMRDAVRFVAAAWPSGSSEARVRFETMALDETRFKDKDDLHRWHHILGRVFALVPEDMFELSAMRTLRCALDTEGFLVRNEPIFRLTTSVGDPDDFMRSRLRRAGVETDTALNRDVLAASEALYAHVGRTTSESPAPDLAALWNEVMALLALLDANPGLHDQLARPAWGHISNAVERVASSPNYAPGANGLPDLATMFSVLDRLLSSRYPEASED